MEATPIISSWASFSIFITKPGDHSNKTDFMKSPSHEIVIYKCSMTVKFHRYLGSTVTKLPVEFQSDIDRLIQKRCNSIAKALSYVFLALTYPYG